MRSRLRNCSAGGGSLLRSSSCSWASLSSCIHPYGTDKENAYEVGKCLKVTEKSIFSALLPGFFTHLQTGVQTVSERERREPADLAAALISRFFFPFSQHCNLSSSLFDSRSERGVGGSQSFALLKTSDWRRRIASLPRARAEQGGQGFRPPSDRRTGFPHLRGCLVHKTMSPHTLALPALSARSPLNSPSSFWVVLRLVR